MLNKIHIKNFQSHSDTELIMDPGINVITGTSDVGKSSIFRAINWLRLNRPVGNAFVKHDSKGGVEVSLDFDEAKIQRIKSKTKNAYKLGKSKFEVVSNNVPTEITEFLNLDDISVQGQHDAYFLLQSSPGEVAKKLNEVAGFQIIDSVTKDVKSAITENTSTKRFTKEHIEKLEEDIAKYEHLDSVEIQLDDIQKLATSYKENLNLSEQINYTLDDISETHGAIADIDGWLEIESAVKPIIVASNTFMEKTNEYETINELTVEVDLLEERIRSLKHRAECENDVEQILAVIKEYNTQSEALNSLLLALKNIKDYSETIDELEIEINELTENMNRLLEAENLCPFCGTKLTDDKKEHIKHWV